MVKMTALMLAAVLSLVASSSHAENHHYYVSVANGRDCPPDSDCHSLSYYLSDPELYFTSNTRITFLEGTHLLDREGPIKISQVTGLTLIGRGQWVRGPEATIMESTAVIYCTNGSGGFSFIDSSQIAINNLSFIDCGALHSDVNNDFYSTILFTNVSSLSLDTVSIQNSSGHGLVTRNCLPVNIYCLSIAYSNIDRKSNIVQCNKFVNGSNLMIMYSNTKLYHNGQFRVRNSNFTDGCGTGSVIFQSMNSQLIDLLFEKIEIVQTLQNSGDGIVILSNGSSVDLHLSDSTIKRRIKNSTKNLARGLWVKTLPSLFAQAASIIIIHVDGISFIDFSGGQLCLEFHGGLLLDLIVNNTVFSHQQVRTPGHQYGVHILFNQSDLKVLVLQNVTMSLENAFEVGLLIEIANPGKLFVPGDLIIQDSIFQTNRNIKSVVSLSINKPTYFTNCVFIENSGNSVISVSTTDHLFLRNVTFVNNSMTAVAVWNGFV